MGRDRLRVVVCAAASIALILASTLAMDWFRVALSADVPGGGKIAIDLRYLHVCHTDLGCASTSISRLHGMFPTLATVTLWSSLGFAALVAFQSGARVLTGAANDSFTKLGYVLALTAISLTVATAYMFGPDAEVPVSDLTVTAGLALPRAWAPLTLLAGLVAGFAALYMAVAAASSDLGATYKPVTFTPPPEGRARTASIPLPFTAASAIEPRRHSAALPVGVPRPSTAGAGSPDPIATAPGARDDRARRESSAPPAGSRPTDRIAVPGAGPGAGAAGPARPGSTPPIARPGSSPQIAHPPGEQPARGRTKSGPLTPLPAHLRNRLQYVAITAELTAGGIDARREDGSSRLVLWRDVVGVAARRLPAAFDSATFVDIVSTAGSTLRIVPWTRLTGDSIEGEPDQRSRGVIERVVARCPGATIDPATRQFLDTGEAVQLADLETLQAHDERLA
jgi:hypothetical protein